MSTELEPHLPREHSVGAHGLIQHKRRYAEGSGQVRQCRRGDTSFPTDQTSQTKQGDSASYNQNSGHEIWT